MAKKEKVIRVIDGDTFETDKRIVRLYDVYAPETGEKGGSKATNALKKLIDDKEVSLKKVSKDRYGRTVAKVKIGNKSVNKYMREKTK